MGTGAGGGAGGGAGNYASMATSIIGNELQGWAALLAKWDMEKTFQHEMARQKQYRDQAMSVFSGAVDRSGAPAAGKMLQEGQAGRMERYTGAQGLPSAVGQESTNMTSARDQAAIGSGAQRRADLEGYGDWQFNQGLQNRQSQRKLSQIENFAGGTASVFPYRMYEAQHGWDQMAQIGAAIGQMGGGQGYNFQQGNQPPVTSQQSTADPSQTWGQYWYSPQGYTGNNNVYGSGGM